MEVTTSSGTKYSYLPFDNSIVVDDIRCNTPFMVKFKPLERIQSLPSVDSFTIGVTEQCNLRCSYCCYSGKYTEHRAHSSQSLSEKTIPSIVQFILSNSQSDTISIDFYGGESLLKFDWIKCFIKEMNNQSSKTLKYELSTNGVLLTKNIVDWLIENNFRLFISIDGIGNFHDEHRRDIAGEGTFKRIKQNIAYIKHISPLYWENNVNIMMTIQDITHLPQIAKTWAEDAILCDKMPYRISEVATSYNDKTEKFDLETESKLYLDIVDKYKSNASNGVLSTFFKIWLAEWINRPIISIDKEVEYPTCIPNNRKLFIDAKGRIGICERIADDIRIGTFEDGIDYNKVNDIANRIASFIKQNCSKCEIARVCNICPDILKLDKSIIGTYCHNQKVMHRIKFRCFCELAEAELI